MKNQLLLPLFILILLSSCIGYKNNPNTHVSIENGKQLIENKKENISLRYYGDYWFHSLNKQNTLNWDKHFIKSLQQSGAKETFLYAGHTTIESYCSTIGVLYESTAMASKLADISAYLKKSLKAENMSNSTIVIGEQNYQVLSYQLRNTALRVSSKYIEYYLLRKKDFVRIIFWTNDMSDGWLQRESEAIIAKKEDNI